MSLMLVSVFIGSFTVTSYRSVPNQTDSSPYYTSIGEKCSISGVAISQDQLCGACRRLHRRCMHPEYNKKIHYGECLYIEDVGFRIVNDCMGKVQHWRVKTKKGFKTLFKDQKDWIDIWVPTYKDEHKFHRKFGINKHKIWVIKGNYETR